MVSVQAEWVLSNTYSCTCVTPERSRQKTSAPPTMPPGSSGLWFPPPGVSVACYKLQIHATAGCALSTGMCSITATVQSAKLGNLTVGQSARSPDRKSANWPIMSLPAISSQSHLWQLRLFVISLSSPLTWNILWSHLCFLTLTFLKSYFISSCSVCLVFPCDYMQVVHFGQHHGNEVFMFLLALLWNVSSNLLCSFIIG